MSSKIAIKGVMKMLGEGSIFTEDLLSDEFFKAYSSMRSMEEFESKFNTAPAKGLKISKHNGDINLTSNDQIDTELDKYKVSLGLEDSKLKEKGEINGFIYANNCNSWIIRRIPLNNQSIFLQTNQYKRSE